MTCFTCKRKNDAAATFCGFCGQSLSGNGSRGNGSRGNGLNKNGQGANGTGGNGFRSDWAATIVDHGLAERIAGGVSSTRLDGKTDPWQGRKPPASTEPKIVVTDQLPPQSPLHDTVPNYAIETAIAPSDELAAAVAQTRPTEMPQAPRQDEAHARTVARGAPAKSTHRADPMSIETLQLQTGEIEPARDETLPAVNTTKAAVDAAATDAQQTAVEDPAKQKAAEKAAEKAEQRAQQQAAKKAAKAEKAAEKARRRGSQPAGRLLRLMMVLFGLGLIGGLALPWILAGGTGGLGAALGQLGIGGYYQLGAGVVLLLTGLIPLPYTLRALLVMGIGLGALGLTVHAGPIDWRSILTLVLMVLLPAALLHRARHRRSILARILVALGVGGLLATLLVPLGGALPLTEMIAAASSGTSIDKLAPVIYPLALVPLCVLCLLAFLGRKRTGLSRLWALLVLLFMPIQAWLGVAVSVHTVGEAFETQLTPLLQGLATFFFLTLAAYGISQLLWKLSGAGEQPEQSAADEPAKAAAAQPTLVTAAGPLKPLGSNA